VLGDTDDTTIYRDAKISRYCGIVYSSILFSIAIPKVSRYFLTILHRWQSLLMCYFRSFVTMESAFQVDLSNIITVKIFDAYCTYKSSYERSLLSCSQSPSADDVL